MIAPAIPVYVEEVVVISVDQEWAHLNNISQKTKWFILDRVRTFIRRIKSKIYPTSLNKVKLGKTTSIDPVVVNSKRSFLADLSKLSLNNDLFSKFCLSLSVFQNKHDLLFFSSTT